ncbi:hypothetical protein AOLI_G00143920 [Acnodon oligacanthus]
MSKWYPCKNTTSSTAGLDSVKNAEKTIQLVRIEFSGKETHWVISTVPRNLQQNCSRTYIANINLQMKTPIQSGSNQDWSYCKK